MERRVYVVDEDDPAQRLFVPDITVGAATRPTSSRPQAATGIKQMPAGLWLLQDLPCERPS